MVRGLERNMNAFNQVFKQLKNSDLRNNSYMENIPKFIRLNIKLGNMLLPVSDK